MFRTVVHIRANLNKWTLLARSSLARPPPAETTWHIPADSEYVCVCVCTQRHMWAAVVVQRLIPTHDMTTTTTTTTLSVSRQPVAGVWHHRLCVRVWGYKCLTRRTVQSDTTDGCSASTVCVCVADGRQFHFMRNLCHPFRTSVWRGRLVRVRCACTFSTRVRSCGLVTHLHCVVERTVWQDYYYNIIKVFARWLHYFYAATELDRQK